MTLPDGSALLLRRWQHAHLHHGHNNAYGIHAEKGKLGSGVEQFCQKYLLGRRRSGSRACHSRNRKRLGVYNPGNLGRSQCGGHLGDAALRTEVESRNGSTNEVSRGGILEHGRRFLSGGILDSKHLPPIVTLASCR